MSLFNFPDLRLTVKLPLLIVATAISVAIAGGVTASWTAYHLSERMIESHLTVIATAKRDELAALVRAVRSDLQSIAGNPAVQRSLDGFAIGFKLLDAEKRSNLRMKYALDVTPSTNAVKGLSDFYGAAYQDMHPWFRTFAREHGYEDVVFVDRDGNIAYTLAKRPDYTQSAITGPLAASVLGRAVEMARRQAGSGTVVTDFAQYEPAGAPVAFAATPIFQKLGDRMDFVGVLALQLPAATINRFINNDQGFGPRGEAMIVGEDGLMRSASRFGSANDVLRRHVDDANLTRLNGATRVAYTRAVGGLPMIAAAAPIDFDGVDWSIVAAESTEDVFAPVNGMMISIGIICLAVTLLLVLVASWIARRMAEPIVELVDRFNAALSNMSHGLCMFDQADRMILCNAEYGRMYGLPPSLMAPGTLLADLLSYRASKGSAPIDRDAYLRMVDGLTGSREAAILRVDLQDGRTIQLTHNPMASGGYVATHQDITEAIRSEAQIKHMASHDALTGLPNRLRLRDTLDDALLRVRKGDSFAVLCLDLDHFKAVNDTLGHPVGDLLLKAVTDRLRQCVRDADTVARLGGDEFVIVQLGVERPEQASDLARRVIEEVCAPFDLQGHQVVIGASIGIALSPDDGNNADILLKNADMALYRAKKDGRGAYRFFEPAMDARLQERRQLELDLRRALARDEFVLHYQPLVDARTEAVTGFEALIRWNHPEKGMISPADFIPVAEEVGVIVPLGEWVLRQACMDAAKWPVDVKVAINLSPVQFKNPTLVLTVISALAESGLSPLRLELEITETVLLAENETTLETLHQLRNLGVRIAMDDFGTGYSSLSYLRSFPFDKIKIDRAFVRDLTETSDCIAIIAAVAGLGAALGMATTAEGVETREQLDQVRAQGCTEVQGYFFSPPRPVADVAAMLGRGQTRPMRRIG